MNKKRLEQINKKIKRKFSTALKIRHLIDDPHVMDCESVTVKELNLSCPFSQEHSLTPLI